MGDEIGLLNDYGFEHVAEHAHDNRWLHRPLMPWRKRSAIEQRVFDGTRHIIERRKACPTLAANNPTRIIEVGNNAVFAFRRDGDEGPLLAMFNFSEIWQNVSNELVYAQGVSQLVDVLSETKVATPRGSVQLPPYARVWLT